jgi:TolB-like protein
MKKTVSFITVAMIISIVICSCTTVPVSPVSFTKTGTIAEAVYEGYANVQEKIPSKRRIAVIGFTGNDLREAMWADDELIHLLVNAKRHVVIDRRGLGPNVAEIKPTGEIEEASAKDIGYLLGAEVVLYGNISHYENRIRFLSLKAMEVLSGEIIAVTSERFTAS